MSSPRSEVVKVKRFLATLPYALDKVQGGVRLVGAAISTSACKAKRIAAVTRPGREPLLKRRVADGIGFEYPSRQLLPVFYRCCAVVHKLPG